MNPIVSALDLLTIFLGPGIVLLTFLQSGRLKGSLTLGEQLFLVLAGSILVSGWIGFLLAEMGLFSASNLAVVVAAVVLISAVIGRKHFSWSPGNLGLEEMVVLICPGGFALTVYFPHFEYILR